MKWMKTLALLAAGLLLALPASAQVAGKENAIEGLQVARQGNEIAVRIDLREPLAELPASFAIAAPAKIALLI
jgi:type IV pilus assembly protein PilQ